MTQTTKKIKVISAKNFSVRPVLATLIAWLYLDRFNAFESWWAGIIYVCVFILWGSFLYGLLNNEHVDIFKERQHD